MADGSPARRVPWWLRRPVCREGAERYLLFRAARGSDPRGPHFVYICQFDSIDVAFWHLLLLVAVVAYREALRTEIG